MRPDDTTATDDLLCALCWRQRPVDTMDPQEGVSRWWSCRDRADCDAEVTRTKMRHQEAMKQRLAKG